MLFLRVVDDVEIREGVCWRWRNDARVGLQKERSEIADRIRHSNGPLAVGENALPVVLNTANSQGLLHVVRRENLNIPSLSIPGPFTDRNIVDHRVLLVFGGPDEEAVMCQPSVRNALLCIDKTPWSCCPRFQTHARVVWDTQRVTPCEDNVHHCIFTVDCELNFAKLETTTC